MNAILSQINAIEEHCLEKSRTLSGFDLGDLRDIALALGTAAKVLHAEVDSRLNAPFTGGLLSGIGKLDGGAA
jgi:hypothetical protein